VRLCAYADDRCGLSAASCSRSAPSSPSASTGIKFAMAGGCPLQGRLLPRRIARSAPLSTPPEVPQGSPPAPTKSARLSQRAPSSHARRATVFPRYPLHQAGLPDGRQRNDGSRGRRDHHHNYGPLPRSEAYAQLHFQVGNRAGLVILPVEIRKSLLIIFR